VKNTIQKLKDKNALGIDLIQAELIKEASPDFIDHMHRLIILKIWTRRLELGYHLSDTQEGRRDKCSNYRGISLLCVAYKIFSSTLFNRLMTYVETAVGDYQSGYRQERSTVGQIFTVRQIRT
jgi:hypothetical protein